MTMQSTGRRDPVGHRREPAPLVVDAPTEAPPASKEWLAVTREDWDAFWTTPVAGLVGPGNLPSLRYLFELRDRRERYLRSSRGSKAVAEGSMGQEVVNPLLKMLPSLDKEIRNLETDFGMNHKGRKNLGLSDDMGRPSLREILDRLDSEDEGDAADPRLKVIDGALG